MIRLLVLKDDGIEVDGIYWPMFHNVYTIWFLHISRHYLCSSYDKHYTHNFCFQTRSPHRYLYFYVYPLETNNND